MPHTIYHVNLALAVRATVETDAASEEVAFEATAESLDMGEVPVPKAMLAAVEEWLGTEAGERWLRCRIACGDICSIERKATRSEELEAAANESAPIASLGQGDFRRDLKAGDL